MVFFFAAGFFAGAFFAAAFFFAFIVRFLILVLWFQVTSGVVARIGTRTLFNVKIFWRVHKRIFPLTAIGFFDRCSSGVVNAYGPS